MILFQYQQYLTSYIKLLIFVNIHANGITPVNLAEFKENNFNMLCYIQLSIFVLNFINFERPAKGLRYRQGYRKRGQEG